MNKKFPALFGLLILTATPLFAAEAELTNFGLAIGAGLAIALAALGGALGQARATAAALEGIARNPGAAGQLFTPMIIGLALIESLVIYGLVIAFILQAKIVV